MLKVNRKEAVGLMRIGKTHWKPFGCAFPTACKCWTIEKVVCGEEANEKTITCNECLSVFVTKQPVSLDRLFEEEE